MGLFKNKKNQEAKVIKNEIGTFYAKEYQYEGSVNYFNKVCDIIIEFGNDDVDIQYKFDKLKIILDNLEEWDKKIKKFVVDEIFESYIEISCSCSENENTMTKENYCNSLFVTAIIISEDGTMCVGVNDSNICFGDTIEVYIDNEGNLFEVQIVS